jgi:hypothetical protein
MYDREGDAMDEALAKLVERLLQGPGSPALRLRVGELQITVGQSPQGGYLLSVGRHDGPVGEREAVDVAVQIHRLIERAGAGIEPEMLAYRGPGRSRCFVLALRELVSA